MKSLIAGLVCVKIRSTFQFRTERQLKIKCVVSCTHCNSIITVIGDVSMLLLEEGGGSAGRGEENIDVSPSSDTHIQIHCLSNQINM